MTREERLDWLCRLRSGLVWFDVPPKERPVFEQVLSEVIKDLEQEPCEDAVSRQTVSYIIKSHIHEIITESGTDKNAHTNAVLRSIVNLVETMPSVTPTQRWIPVSERLPEDGYWAIFTNGKQISIERYKHDALDHFYPHGRLFNLEDAVAWMPLPERYKAEMGSEE